MASSVPSNLMLLYCLYPLPSPPSLPPSLPSSLPPSLSLSLPLSLPPSLPFSLSLSLPSYQRDVLAMLAEQLMINCEGNSGEEEETTPISPTELLPPLDATPTAVARESPRRRKARSTAVLNRFMKMDLKLLSRESRYCVGHMTMGHMSLTVWSHDCCIGQISLLH